MQKKISAAVLLIAVIFSCGSASAEEWRSLTDMRDVRDIVFVTDMIWCATGGGLVGFHPSGEYFETFTFLDGLQGTSLNRLASDSEGGIWMIVEKRSLQRFATQNRQITHTISIVHEISSINDVCIDNRGIFLATNVGVGKVRYYPELDKWYWFEKYTKLGVFPDEEGAGAVLVQGDFLWVATARGIARGDLNTPAPLTWEVFTTTTQKRIPGNLVMDIALLNDTIYAATDGGVCCWDGSDWSNLNGGIITGRLEVQGGTLCAVTGDSLVAWDGISWEKICASRKSITSVALDNQDRFWVGLGQCSIDSGGIAVSLNHRTWKQYLPDCPTTNTSTKLLFASNTDLLMIGGVKSGEYGFNRWNGSMWRTWSNPKCSERYYGFQPRGMAIDINDDIWVGTFGGGLARYCFDSEANKEEIVIYNEKQETGGRLSVSEEARTYVLTPDVAADSKGNLWVVTRSSSDKTALLKIPRDYIASPDTSKQWIYYHRSLFRNYPYLDILAIDNFDRIWLATTATTPDGLQGIYCFDGDTAVDLDRGPFSGLNIPEAHCLTWDPAGYIWAGTVDGAYYINTNQTDIYSASFTRFYETRNEPVNAIGVDPAGNRWLGTNHGIIVVGPDLFTIIDRISADPPNMLPDPVITTIAIDPRDGWAYIGTKNGTVAMRTPYRDFGERISSVSVEPNPFNPNTGRMYFTGSTLANEASVRIYTPDGRLVRKLDHLEAGFGWDGRDSEGRGVASGIYIILAYDNDRSQSGRGKVAVIWK